MAYASQLVQTAGFDSLAEAVRAAQEDGARQQLLTSGCLPGLAKHFRHMAFGANAEDTFSPETLDLGRLLRNLCAGGPHFKAILVAEGVATAAADWAVASAAGTERKVAVQLLVNLATEDQDAALAVSAALSPAWMTALAAQLDGSLLGPVCRLLLEVSSCPRQQASDTHLLAVPAVLRAVARLPELGQALPDFLALMHLMVLQLEQLGPLLDLVFQPQQAPPGSQESGRTAAATTPAAGDTLVTLLEATSAVLTAAASGASLSLQASCGPGALTCAVQLAALLPQLLAAWTCGRSGSHSRDRALPNEHATDGGSAAVAAAPSAKPSQDGAAALQAELDAARGLHSTPEPVSQRSDLLPDMSEPQLAACMEELLQGLSTIAGMEAEECRGVITAVSHELIPLLLAMLAALGPVQRWQPTGNAAEQTGQRPQQMQMPAAVQCLVSTCPRAQLFQGYRTAIIAVLANICYQRPNLQTAVHEAGGTYLLLSQCQVDEKSPLTREWAVLATRNLCEGRSDIQAAISELQAVTAGQSEESGGVELSLNAATGKVGVKHGST